MKKLLLIVLAIGLKSAFAQSSPFALFMDAINIEPPFFHSTDPLAQRDDLGLLHQNRTNLNDTDFAHRHPFRPLYWIEGRRELTADPAYMGAVQRDLARLGYYCGPINGVWSSEVSDAIARLQKNYSMRVTGTLTIPVRRALHLP
jgi:Putative peptidoglycan binding domain